MRTTYKIFGLTETNTKFSDIYTGIYGTVIVRIFVGEHTTLDRAEQFLTNAPADFPNFQHGFEIVKTFN